VRRVPLGRAVSGTAVEDRTVGNTDSANWFVMDNRIGLRPKDMKTKSKYLSACDETQ
jgi:hypothetical protein